MLKLISGDIAMRPLEINDASSLAEMANNVKIWNNIRDIMPHPYTLQDAWNFIAMCEVQEPQTTFAIDYKGKLSGIIGLSLQTDVYRHTAELGYWIGENFWSKGIASEAVKLIVNYGFENLNLIRIYSAVFDYNKASQRVLEKNGFKLEGIAVKGFIKNGKVGDEYRYGIIKD